MAAVTVNWSETDDTNTSFRKEIIQLTSAASGDTYTSATIGEIVGAEISANYAAGAADSWSVTFAANVATLTLVGTTADDFTLVLYGRY